LHHTFEPKGKYDAEIQRHENDKANNEAINKINKDNDELGANLDKIKRLPEQNRITIGGRAYTVKEAREKWNKKIEENNGKIETAKAKFDSIVNGYNIANPKYTFERALTDNIMDYDMKEGEIKKTNPNERICFYKHQWDAMNKAINYEPYE
jgi:hypothetical protein